MTNHRLLTCASCVALIATPLLAQQPTDPNNAPVRPGQRNQGQDPDMARERGLQQATTAKQWTTLDRLLDATFVLGPARAVPGREPIAEEVREERKKGEIENVIVDSRSGEVRWVVLSTGDLLDDEKSIAVPADKLRLMTKGEDGENLMFGLDAPIEKLRAAPGFDVDSAKKGDLRLALEKCEGVWMDAAGQRGEPRDATAPRDPRGGNDPQRDPRDPAAKTPERRGDDPRMAGAMGGPNYILSDTLKGMDVRAGVGEEKGFGEISQVFIDLNRHRIDYVIASEGGVLGIGETDYLIPYRAGTVARMGDGDEMVFRLQKSAQELEKAVKYVKPEAEALVLDPSLAQRANDFFGIRNDAMDDRGMGGKDGVKGRDEVRGGRDRDR